MPDKIRIRLLTHASGPHFQLAPGQHDLDPKLARDMIDGGFAEEVEVAEEDQAIAAQESDGGAVETATAQPQRSQEADDLVAAERAGADAAAAGAERKAPDGVDGRSARGRAWYRGYDSYGQEYRTLKQE